MQVVLDYLKQNQKRFVAELCELLRFPSVSAQPQHKKDLRACAEWLVQHCRAIGLEAKLCPTAGHPIVLAKTPRVKNSRKPHFMVYGHYDVQPPEPLDLWQSPPFAPRIVGKTIFARGSTDNKGQFFAHLKAVEAYLKTGTPLPCDLTFVIEGEEEVGSENLAKFLKSQSRGIEMRRRGRFRHRHAQPKTSRADLCAARHHRVRDQVARAGARPALRRFWRRGGKSGNGLEPVAGPDCTIKTAASPFPDFTTASFRCPHTNGNNSPACR